MTYEAKRGETLIFSCSGAADVGEIADRAARELTRRGTGSMFCLAGVGGDVEPVMQRTRKAGRLVTIEGCDKACAKRTLERNGFDVAASVTVTELGLAKGQWPATAENVNRVADATNAAI